MDKNLIVFDDEEHVPKDQRSVTNNTIALSGTIVSEDVQSYWIKNVLYNSFIIEVRRLSNSSDFLPISVSERIFNINLLKTGAHISLIGQVLSSNRLVDGKNRLILNVIAREVDVLIKNFEADRNHAILIGFLCRKPVFRQTPKGRKIADLLVAVHRPNNKSDYLPVIAWGKNAEISNTLNAGDEILVYGRMQSRVYQKVGKDGTVTEKIAYEISAGEIKAAIN